MLFEMLHHRRLTIATRLITHHITVSQIGSLHNQAEFLSEAHDLLQVDPRSV